MRAKLKHMPKSSHNLARYGPKNVRNSNIWPKFKKFHTNRCQKCAKVKHMANIYCISCHMFEFRPFFNKKYAQPLYKFAICLSFVHFKRHFLQNFTTFELIITDYRTFSHFPFLTSLPKPAINIAV